MKPSKLILLSTTGLLAFGALGACSSDEEQAAPMVPPGPAAGPPAVAKPAQGAPATAPAAPAVKPESFAEPEGADEPGALTAFADVDESIGDAPHTVKLDVDVIDGTGHPPFTYIWDFGDATEFSTEKSPSHVYKIPGSFRASVIVTDSKGETDQDYFDISVNEALEPGAITAEQLMEMMPLEEVAPGLKGMEGAIKKRGTAQ